MSTITAGRNLPVWPIRGAAQTGRAYFCVSRLLVRRGRLPSRSHRWQARSVIEFPCTLHVADRHGSFSPKMELGKVINKAKEGGHGGPGSGRQGGLRACWYVMQCPAASENFEHSKFGQDETGRMRCSLCLGTAIARAFKRLHGVAGRCNVRGPLGMESGGNSNTTACLNVTMAVSYSLNCEGGIGAGRRRVTRCGSSDKVSVVLGNKSK
jgi:hypothetical protein